MGSLVSFLSLGLLVLMSLFTDGSSRYFKVSPKAGEAPLQVTFTANELYGSKQAEKFIWILGNGETITTTSPNLVYTYNEAGTFLASLKYLKKKTDALSKAKDGGSVKIVVKEKPNLLPTPELSCVSNSINNLECNANGSSDLDGSIVSYKYDWGDDSNNLVSIPETVSHSYAQAGEKTVRLTVTDNKGGSAFIEKSFLLKMNTAPVANFSCSKTGIQKIHCESTSTDNEENISNFAWTLDDGATYSSASFDHTFNRPEDVAIASHNVSLMVTDALGLESSLAKDIEVNLEAIREAPRGYFKAYIDGTTVDLRAFIVKTQFNIKQATYQIYDAQNNLLHTLPISGFYQNHSTKINLENFGNYRVTLTIVDYRDQQIVVTRQVPLVEDTSTLSPFVAFRAIQSNIRTLYLNLNQSFDYDENYSIREFIVNLGNGQTRVLTTDTFLTYTYPEAGTYTLTVTAKANHGTERTFSQSITITDNEVAPVMPDPTFAYRIYSFAQNVSFYNEKSGTPNGEIISYLWDFGDGTTASGETQAHFYMPGEYLVKLTVVDTAGYSSTQTQKITILAEGDDIVANIDCSQRPPYLDITQMCKINALDKFNEINRIRVVWGDGAVFSLTTPFDPRQGVYYAQKAYTTEGTYPVRLIVNTVRGDFKTHDISHTVTARKPVANIQCLTNNLLVNCSAIQSFDPKGGTLSYTFDYQDGFTETNTTGFSSHAYQEAGLFNVTVTVKDSTNLTSSASTQVQTVVPENVLPVADLNCVASKPLTLSCNAGASFDNDGVVFSAKYEFDDGAIATHDPNFLLSHQFTSAGNHSVKLTVTDNSGGQGSIEKIFEVLPNLAPEVAIDCSFDYYNYMLNCNSEVSDDGIILSKEWEINNETYNLNDYFFSKSVSDIGENIVSFTVVDEFGASVTKETVVNVKENSAPVIEVFCESKLPKTLSCYNFSYDPEGHPYSVEWTIENEIYFGHEILVTIAEGGMKTVNVKATDLLGASRIIEVPVLVMENIAPLVHINCFIQSGTMYECRGDASTDSDGYIVSYKWTIEGNEISGANIVYSFLNGGNKEISLKVTDNLGKDSVSSISINLPIPEIGFTCEETSALRVVCEKIASEDEEDILEYKYIFDDNYVESGESVEFEFSSFGQHKIEMISIDKKANISSTSQVFNFPLRYLPPVARFDTFAVLNSQVNLNAGESYYQERKVQKFVWNFGDGETLETTDSSINHTYNTFGLKQVTLTAHDLQGATSTLSKEVMIYDPEVPDPDQSRNLTITGVDSDDDKIRDDIQRWVNYESRIQTNIKPILRKLAASWEMNIASPLDRAKAIDQTEKRQKIGFCLQGILNSEEDASYYVKMMEYFYFDHESRGVTHDNIKGGSAGAMIISTPETQAELLEYCQQI